METKKPKKKKLKSVEEIYNKYKRKSKLKRHLIMGGIKFDIDPKYEIIDLGNYIFLPFSYQKPVKVPMD